MQSGREPKQAIIHGPVWNAGRNVFQRVGLPFFPDKTKRPVPSGRGVRVSAEGGHIMFEDQPQSEIEARRARDPEFRILHDEHRKLNRQCMDAELGVLAVSDGTLGKMKREKLLAKQRLQRMLETPAQSTSSPAH